MNAMQVQLDRMERQLATLCVALHVPLVEPPAPARKERRRKPERVRDYTPSNEFHDLLLKALAALGGQATAKTVRQWFIENYAFLPGDYHTTTSGGPRWWHNVRWARQDMVDDGRLRRVAKRGVWALS